MEAKEMESLVYGLIGRGTNLFAAQGRNVTPRPLVGDYAALVDDWSAFVAAHPESNAEPQGRFKRFLDNLTTFVMGMERNGYSAADAEALKARCRAALSDLELTRYIPEVNRMWYCSAGILPMGCVGRETINRLVLCDHAKYRVNASTQLMANGRMDEAAAIIGNLRRMLGLTPIVKAWAERVRMLEIRAVYDYGAPLRAKLWGEYRQIGNYVQMLTNWREFFKAHPICNGLYLEGFEVFLGDARSFAEAMLQNGEKSGDMEKFKESLEYAWREMPARVRLRKWKRDRIGPRETTLGRGCVLSQGSRDYENGMPLHVDWTITSFCNFRCSYCFAAGKEYKKDFCTLEQAETAIKHVASTNRSAYSVTLIGGEPTAHPHLAEIITLLQKHLGDRLEQITTVSNGSFSERQMEAILDVIASTEVRMIISIHLEYMGVDRVASLVKRLSNHVILDFSLMFHPELFDKAKAMANALCELRKEYPYFMKIGELREPPRFDRWDSRYTQEHLDWMKETKIAFDGIASASYHKKPICKKRTDWRYWVEKKSGNHIEVHEGLDNGKLKELTQFKFEDMTCCSGVSNAKIGVDGTVRGMVCHLDPPRGNIFEENPFEREDWVHGVRCTMRMCGCGANFRIPKFRSAEEAERFIAEKRLEHKKLMSEYKGE